MTDNMKERALWLFKLDFYKALAGTLPMAVALWLVFVGISMSAGMLFGTDIGREDRNVIIFVLAFIFTVYIPSGAFPYLNQHRNDIIHVLLPVSRTLKFCSVIIVGSVLLPMIYLLCLYFTDWLIQALMEKHSAFPAGYGYLAKISADLFMAQAGFVICNLTFRKRKMLYSVLCMILPWGVMFFFSDVAALRYGIPSAIYLMAYYRFRKMEL